MDAHNETGSGPRRGWRGWLGLSSPEAQDGPDTSGKALSPDPTAREVWLPAKRRILGRVADFLIDHDLEVLPFTLSVAYEYVTGSNPRLGQKILERSEKGLPITMKWLEEISGVTPSNDGAEAIATILDQLGDSMGKAGEAMADTRSAANAYASELQDHAESLKAVSGSNPIQVKLASLTRGMIDRTRKMEADLERSERRAAQLQTELDETRRLAEQDHLTGLPNRRAFDAMFERERREAQETGEALCVAFCDVDNFKRINDAHGHPTGDRVLKLVAETLGRIASGHCHVARHGGEEFALLFRGSTLKQAWAKLDAARAEIADRRLVNRVTEMPLGKVTFSGGIADVMAYNTRAAALKAADDALLAAKEAGRNRVLMAGERPPDPLREAA